MISRILHEKIKIATVTVASLVSIPAFSQDLVWPEALRTGSDRMALFALAEERPAGSDAFRKILALPNGVTQKSSSFLSSTVQSGLIFDDNINGGINAKSITVSGFEFSIDPNSRAVSGVTPILKLSSKAGYAFSDGLVLSVFQASALQYSPKLKIGKASLTYGACATQYRNKGWFADICASQTRVHREMGSQSKGNLRFSIEKIIKSEHAVHSFAVTPQVEYVKGNERGLLRFDWQVSNATMGGLSLHAVYGQTPSTYLGTTREFGFEIKPKLGSSGDISLVAKIEKVEGEKVLGAERKDIGIMLALKKEIYDLGTVSVGIENRRSNIEGLSRNSFLLSLDFPAF